jgi:hypothetical protein
MVFSHRVPEREAGRLLVLGQDVRDAKGVAPDLGALLRRPPTLQRRAAPKEQRGANRCDERNRGRRRAHLKRRYF